MNDKRITVGNLWFCDYCGRKLGKQDKGYLKGKYTLCKECKHYSIESIQRKIKI